MLILYEQARKSQKRTPAQGPSSEPPTPGTQSRRGAKGRAQDKKSSGPGQLDNPRGSCKIEGNEQTFAAYLGFTSTVESREFLLSWPGLKTVREFQDSATGISKHDALVLIRDSESELCHTTNPDEAWPLAGDEDKAMTGSKRHRHIAWCLLQLEKDITIYVSQGDEANHAMNSE